MAVIGAISFVSGKALADTLDDQADALVRAMTLDEKLRMVVAPTTVCPTTAVQLNIWGVFQRLGVSPIADGAAGCSGTPNNPSGTFRGLTVLPSGPALGAAFDPSLAYEYGDLQGKEVRDTGSKNTTSPNDINLTRDPRGGRTFETPGEDPLLVGTIAGQKSAGTQANNVIAGPKHFALNDQEQGRYNMNAQISERGMRESDLLAFEIAIKQGDPGLVMASYNAENGFYSSSNNHLLNEILKGDWGFKGFVYSDAFLGIQSALDANTGIDFDIGRTIISRTPPATYPAVPPIPEGSFFLTPLRNAADPAICGASCPVQMARLDDMVHRIVRQLLRFKLVRPMPANDAIFDAAGVARLTYADPYLADNPLTTLIESTQLNTMQLIDDARGKAVAQKVEERGAVLLKNNGALPLNRDTLQSIAVIGSKSDRAVLQGGGSASTSPIGGKLAGVPAVSSGYGPYAIGGPCGNPTTNSNTCIQNNWVPSSPKDAISALAPGASVTYGGVGSTGAAIIADAVAAASGKDAAVVFVHSFETEGRDMISLKASSGLLGMDCGSTTRPDGIVVGVNNAECVDQDALVAAVAAVNPNTIVVLETGGAVLMPWLNDVKAVVEAWYPGISGGKAIANLLFGEVNPSGKLPITFPASEADLPRPTSPAFQTPSPVVINGISYPWCFRFCGTGPNGSGLFNVDYNIEGQNVGYKWYESQNKPVLFPFGHGLSYTTFSYSNIQTTPVASDGTAPITVEFDLTNTGSRDGDESAQVYLRLPASTGETAKRLVGFKRVSLAAGETKHVTIIIDPASASHPLSYWADSPVIPNVSNWTTDEGQYIVSVGASSQDIKSEETIFVDRTAPTVSVTCPSTVLLNSNSVATVTASDGLSGLTTTPPATIALNTSSVGGPRTASYTAVDNAGNFNTASCSYNVIYDFAGFFQPVSTPSDPAPFNDMKAGAAVPVKFSLAGNQGLGIFAAGYPTSVQIACPSQSAFDPVDEVVTASTSSLQYDATSNTYIYVWKTDKSWAGTCRQLNVKLNDGTSHLANFHFTK